LYQVTRRAATNCFTVLSYKNDRPSDPCERVFWKIRISQFSKEMAIRLLTFADEPSTIKQDGVEI